MTAKLVKIWFYLHAFAAYTMMCELKRVILIVNVKSNKGEVIIADWMRKKWTKWRDKDFKNLQRFKLRMLKGPVFILWSFTYRSHWVIVGPFMSIWVHNLKDKPWHKKVWKTSFVIIYQFFRDDAPRYDDSGQRWPAFFNLPFSAGRHRPAFF